LDEKMIPFNKPYLHGRELVYIAEAVASGKISGDGLFSKRCHNFFEQRYGIHKALLTTSCTDALEMCALLLNIGSEHEVIVPSFTFVSSANAFALRGARIVFADSEPDNPNISVTEIKKLITPRTRAIVVVHYAGIACEMTPILELAAIYGLAVVEDAAQAIDSYYRGRPLGTLGDLGAFSFHETKNIISGEGGMLAVNNQSLTARAEIIREKGTNRSSFFRGEVDKYGWVDLGSSFLPSDIIAAYLYAQLEVIDIIQLRRKQIWLRYMQHLSKVLPNYGVTMPIIPEWATNNAHMFFIVMRDLKQRTELITLLRHQKIHAVFHYLSLHRSPYFRDIHDARKLPNSDRFTDCLLRLPLYYEMSNADVDRVAETVIFSLSQLS
jgi:dTDP-4-amino-4,6-dideoxygalactose transaminase